MTSKHIFRSQLLSLFLLCIATLFFIIPASAQEEGADATKLLVAAINTSDAAKALEALNRGADSNFQTGTGTTMLMFAAAKGNAEIVSLLIKRGANANVRNDVGRTALMFAVVSGDARMVSEVLAATAANVIDAADTKNYSALMLAEKKGDAESARLIRERLAADAAQARFRLERRGNPFASLGGAATLDAQGQKPRLYMQRKHDGEITSVAFTPDGHVLASAGVDKTIKLWDAATGVELRTIPAHTDEINAIAMSPDGRLLASASSDHTIKLWDIRTGSELKTLIGHELAVASLAFSPDGKLLASGSFDKTVKLWEVASGQLLKTLSGHESYVSGVLFSPDGRSLFSGGGDDMTVRLWDIAKGALVQTLSGHTKAVNSIALSADGRTLASASSDETIRLWDAATGALLRNIKQAGEAYALSFRPDGKTLAVGSRGQAVKLYDTRTGFKAGDYGDFVFAGQTAVAFSPDGARLVCGDKSGEVLSWDMATGENSVTYTGREDARKVHVVAISPDGKLIASGNGDGKIWLWGGTGGGGAPRLVGSHLSWITALVFQADGRTLISSSDDGAVKVWDAIEGRKLKTIIGPQAENEDATGLEATLQKTNATLAWGKNSITSLALTPDGKLLAGAGNDKTVRVWELPEGNLRYTLQGHEDNVRSVSISPDGRLLASASFDQKIRLWDLAAGKLVRVIDGGGETVAFSPDGKTLINSQRDGYDMHLFEVATGKALRTFTGHTNFPAAFAFQAGGQLLITASWDRTIKLWNVATGKVLRTLTGHTNDVVSIALSPDGKTVVSGSDDGTVRLWDIATGSEIASLIASDTQSWLVVNANGLFDGAPDAWSQLFWRLSENLRDIAPVESYFNEFYSPGLLDKILAGERTQPASDLTRKDRRQPELTLSLADGQNPLAALTTRNVTVRINLSHALAGAQDVRLFRNGSLVKVFRGDALHGKTSATLEASVAIIAGENLFTAYAFNLDNVKSGDARLTLTGAESLRRKGTAYIIAVGVNEYANAEFNLRYAVPDAQLFSEELQRQQSGLNRFAKVEVVTLYDRDATRENVLLALKLLAEGGAASLPANANAGLQSLQAAQPEDAVMLYFSGHGLANGSRFYLIPHDLGYAGARNQVIQNLSQLSEHGLSDRQLEAALEGVDAGELLLIIDACNSGQALESTEKRFGPMNSTGLAQLAYEKGMYIMTAAQGYQQAVAPAKLGHGYLTYALVTEGLQQTRADGEPKDGQVLIKEWFDYATARVPQMQEAGDKERRIIEQEEEKNSKPAARAAGVNAQRPRVFYRREPEAQPLIIAKAK